MHCGGAKNPLGWKGGAGLMSPVCARRFSALWLFLCGAFSESARVNSCAKSRSPARMHYQMILAREPPPHYHCACSLFKYKKNSCRPLIRARAAAIICKSIIKHGCAHIYKLGAYYMCSQAKETSTERDEDEPPLVRTHT